MEGLKSSTTSYKGREPREGVIVRGKGYFGAASGGSVRSAKAGGITLDTETHRYIDKSIEAVKAQNDARFSEVLFELRSLREGSITWKQVWGAAAATTISVAGILLTVLAISGDRFDGGLSASSIVENAVQQIAAEQVQRDAAQDARIDRILEALESQATKQAE